MQQPFWLMIPFLKNHGSLPSLLARKFHETSLRYHCSLHWGILGSGAYGNGILSVLPLRDCSEPDWIRHILIRLSYGLRAFWQASWHLQLHFRRSHTDLHNDSLAESAHVPCSPGWHLKLPWTHHPHRLCWMEFLNWDDYYGYRQLTHGNMHGTAMYVKDFTADIKSGKRYFLRFDGVGTYATIKVNGTDFGRHPVGRTTLTLDVTDAMKQGINRLEVKAEHPEMIADMPWVCGGCSGRTPGTKEIC